MHMTSRDFNQDLAKAKRESLKSPVIITDRGTPKHVLMSYEKFESLAKTKKLANQPKSLFDYFAEADPAVADIELDIPPRSKAQRPSVDCD